MDPHLQACLAETLHVARGAAPAMPTVGVVLGSGLGTFVDRMRNVVRVPAAALPHAAVPRTRDNAGDLCFGVIDDVSVACLDGTSHLYEGYPAWQVVHAARVLGGLGCRAVLLADAVGALDPAWTPGTMVVVQDHLDLMAEAFAVTTDGAFRPPSEVATFYDAALSQELHEVARSETLLSGRIGKRVEIALTDGVYAAVRDPSTITAAQGRMLHALGAHVVGASVVPQAAALRAMGVRVVALGYVTWLASPVLAAAAEEVTGRYGLAHLERILRGWVLRAHRA